MRHRSARKHSKKRAQRVLDLAIEESRQAKNEAIVPVKGVGNFLGTLIAIGALIVIGSVAFGTMLGTSSLLHHFAPSRPFNPFHVFHEPLALGLLVAAAFFWVLPPHPWTGKLAEPTRDGRITSEEKGDLSDEMVMG